MALAAAQSLLSLRWRDQPHVDLLFSCVCKTMRAEGGKGERHWAHSFYKLHGLGLPQPLCRWCTSPQYADNNGHKQAGYPTVGLAALGFQLGTELSNVGAGSQPYSWPRHFPLYYTLSISVRDHNVDSPFIFYAREPGKPVYRCLVGSRSFESEVSVIGCRMRALKLRRPGHSQAVCGVSRDSFSAPHLPGHSRLLVNSATPSLASDRPRQSESLSSHSSTRSSSGAAAGSSNAAMSPGEQAGPAHRAPSAQHLSTLTHILNARDLAEACPSIKPGEWGGL